MACGHWNASSTILVLGFDFRLKLETLARAMSGIAEESRQHVHNAAGTAHETPGSAAMVAAAVEEPSSSMNNTGVQIVNASEVVAEAGRRTEAAVSHASEPATAVQHIDQIATMITAIVERKRSRSSLPEQPVH